MMLLLSSSIRSWTVMSANSVGVRSANVCPAWWMAARFCCSSIVWLTSRTTTTEPSAPSWGWSWIKGCYLLSLADNGHQDEEENLWTDQLRLSPTRTGDVIRSVNVKIIYLVAKTNEGFIDKFNWTKVWQQQKHQFNNNNKPTNNNTTVQQQQQTH